MKNTRLSSFACTIVSLLALWLFSAQTPSYAQQNKLTAAIPALDQWFGYSVAISGDYLLAGAYGDSSFQGSVYVFQRDGSAWVEQQKIQASDGTDFDYFASTLALDGATAAIGAWGDDDDGQKSGSVYILQRIDLTWEEQAKLIASDAFEGDRFGGAVALDGNELLIGAFRADHSGLFDAGAVYLFTGSGASWSETAKLTAGDPGASDLFGWSVDLRGNLAAVGAYKDDHSAVDAGSVYLFEQNGGGWLQQDKLTASDAGLSHWFGYSVAFMNDSTLLVGAPQDDDGGSRSGAVYVFERNGASWLQTAKLSANDRAPSDFFGWAFASNSNALFVGAWGDDDRGSESGAVYQFERTASSWNQTDKIVASDGGGFDWFGRSVAANDTFWVAGAYGDDLTSFDEGSIYVHGSVAACNAIALPDTAEYGNIKGGDQSHVQSVTFCFGGKEVDQLLTFEGYDLDNPNEVDILLNGQKVFDVPAAIDGGWSKVINVILDKSLLNKADSNLITFDNVRNPPKTWSWGVRQVSVADFDDCYVLPTAQAFGKIKGGDENHLDEVSFCFPGRSGDLYVAFQAYDIDQPDEVDVLVNGVHVLDVPVTADLDWSGQLGVLIPDALIADTGQNILTFDNSRNPPKNMYWGVREISLRSCIELPDLREYGKIPGSDLSHLEEAAFCFAGMPADALLEYEAYDIDFAGEVDILLNGVKLDEVVVTPDNQWGDRISLILPDSLLNAQGHNLLVFDNIKNPPKAFAWGVRSVSVEAGLSLPMVDGVGKIKGIGNDTSHPNMACFNFTGQGGDLTLEYDMFDIDSDGEVIISLNGVQISSEATTPNNSWSTTRYLQLPDALVKDAGNNLLVFDNVFNPPLGNWWGVRRMSLSDCPELPQTTAVGKIHGKLNDKSHVNFAAFQFAGQSGDVTLQFEVYDIDSNKETDILLNGIHVHDILKSGNNTWSATRSITLPDAMVMDSGTNILIFDNAKNPPGGNWWGVREVSLVP